MGTYRYTYKIERFWVDKFIYLYNARFDKRFIISKHNEQESPDVECEDIVTGEYLGLEVKRFASIPNDLIVDNKLAHGKDAQFGNSLGRRGDVDKILEEMKKLVACMQDTSYMDMQVALLLPSVFDIWTCREFVSIAGENLSGVTASIKDNFPSGIWYFCKNENGDQDMINLADF